MANPGEEGYVIGEFDVVQNARALFEGRLAQAFAVSVVTPRGEVAAGSADEIIAPGALGELGLLPGHVPLLAALRAGVLVLRTGDQRRVLAVGPGYLELTGARVVVLTDRSAAPASIDLEAVRAEATQAEAALAAAGDEAARILAASKVAWARARVAAAEQASR